jgi:hypothetical protein
MLDPPRHRGNERHARVAAQVPRGVKKSGKSAHGADANAAVVPSAPSESLARLRRLHLQGVVHAVEVVEQARHRGNLDDFAFVILRA